jgi:nitroimidazol reductase NimA-like FMN-containing flavoprotein (pyridoxamine 5'-phosphate oxidase superfamily)
MTADTHTHPHTAHTPDLPVTDRTRLRRMREKGRTRRADLDAVLAAGFLCHLAVVVDGTPMAVPTVYGATADTLYIHGSVAGRSLVQAPHATVCVTVTHLDGIVLARSVFEHGVNYRSAMIYATPRVVTDPDEKLEGLRVLTEQCVPGQWDYARTPSRKELAATTLLALDLAEASVKVRTGPPDDGDSPDADLDVWAGVLPVTTLWGPPVPDPALRTAIPLPPHITRTTGTDVFPTPHSGPGPEEGSGTVNRSALSHIRW